MTNLRLSWYSGSDTYLYTLGKELIARGHEVSIYSPNISYVYQGRRFKEAGFKVFDSLETSLNILLKDKEFDVIHGQHNQPVSEVSKLFPKLPVIFVSHGILLAPEKVPKDVLISKYIAVSEEVYEFQFKDIEESRKLIIRNPIDLTRFSYSPKKIGERLKIVVSSNYFHNTWKGEEIWEMSKELNADIVVLGTNGKITFETEKEIKECDLGIGVGRSILEVMAMGKPAIVGDYAGYDGVITPENYGEIRKRNFSSRTNKEQWDGKKLSEEIKKIFSGDYIKMGKKNRDIIAEHHNLKNIADSFEAIYKEVAYGNSL
jgi:glycosyltransferase involved in cell wall biosynthesis